MSRLLASVQQGFDSRCLVQGRLTKAGCRVSLKGTPRRMVVDLDHPSSPRREDAPCCDYLVFAAEPDGDEWFAPIELKRGELDAGEVVAQLQGGADIGQQAVPSTVSFFPIAAVGKVPRQALERLRRPASHIRFHRHREQVRLIRCGDPVIRGVRR